MMKFEEEPYRVGILGATGAVGQQFVELLMKHPWLTVETLGGSERTVGKTYKAATGARMPSCSLSPLSDETIMSCTCDEFEDCDLVFSALDSSVAGEIERNFADHGFPVFSNAKNHRNDTDVPILLPLVNPSHLDIVTSQATFVQNNGFIVTNANCSSTGLTIAVAPIHRTFGISKMAISTLQAVSGAGYPGLSALDIIDNVIPFIKDEEEKLETEPNKILGTYNGDTIQHESIIASAACHRVGVSDGHIVSVSLKLQNLSISPALKPVELLSLVRQSIISFPIPSEVQQLPSCPEYAIKLFNEIDRPQPKKDRMIGDGMTVCIGRLRNCPLFDVKMTILSNNMIVGAAGGSILNAELAISRGYIPRRVC
ncbi:aspartate-semialdehyde dehydrogenase [Cardiosporidium cionae]|uniref:Aspartate-semialdehyde dehydrogenase n=1 Tax=Cardiosporidium cionae TaxID=476202 RepID=A0ABQ7JBD5_9APIC|nr:aspartate-semialdehyde dehydrogenase [Cardiosporidium cionae]|eukprot:KAF8821219.1 aspartate-semialdehyde dehydrogenase [Cardiosporidium cionae]